MFRCRHCDLLQRIPILSDAEYSALYGAAGDHWQQANLRSDQSKVRAYILGALPNGGSVLDIGCAAGALLDSLGERYQKFGVEPSEQSAGKARQLAISIIAKSVDDLKGVEQTFDIICAVDVIEHVPNPLDFLLRLAPHLKAGGEIVISTGNSQAPIWRLVGPSYYYSHHFEHISFISPKWCAFTESRGLKHHVIDDRFRHEIEDSGRGRVKRFLRFAGRWMASTAERLVLMRLPSETRRLGPRIMVGEPGLFRDHLMASFRSAGSRAE